jgi:AraC-like DNA-binding protein
MLVRRWGTVLMKVARDGRIVLWDGGSFWAFDVLPRPGSPASTQLHAHHALQLTMAAGGEYKIWTEQGPTLGPLVLIAPDTPHAFEPVGRTAMIFVEPESWAGQALLTELNGAPLARLDPDRLPGVERQLSLFWREPRASNDEIADLGQRLLEQLLGGLPAPSALDPRISRAIAWVEPRVEDHLTLAQAASVACMSESRFSHCFTKETGLPFRTWLLWRRLMRAVERMAAGDSLTTAALESGFSDSAHFSRTFMRMFGVQASALGLV